MGGNGQSCADGVQGGGNINGKAPISYFIAVKKPGEHCSKVSGQVYIMRNLAHFTVTHYPELFMQGTMGLGASFFLCNRTFLLLTHIQHV